MKRRLFLIMLFIGVVFNVVGQFNQESKFDSIINRNYLYKDLYKSMLSIQDSISLNVLIIGQANFFVCDGKDIVSLYFENQKPSLTEDEHVYIYKFNEGKRTYVDSLLKTIHSHFFFCDEGIYEGKGSGHIIVIFNKMNIYKIYFNSTNCDISSDQYEVFNKIVKSCNQFGYIWDYEK